jgi:y4mF family transcriptional regulator
LDKNTRPFGLFLKEKRKETGLSQEELAYKAGVGLRFIRDVEQGKRTIRLDKLNVVLSLFGYQAAPVRHEVIYNDSQTR